MIDDLLKQIVLSGFSILMTVLGGIATWKTIRSVTKRYGPRSMGGVVDAVDDRVAANIDPALVALSGPFSAFRKMGYWVIALGIIGLGLRWASDQLAASQTQLPEPYAAWIKWSVPYLIGAGAVIFFIVALIRSRQRHLAFEAMLRRERELEAAASGTVARGKE